MPQHYQPPFNTKSRASSNVTGTREELGKNPNGVERGKNARPTFYGVDETKKLADDCVVRAINGLSLVSTLSL